MIKCPYLLDILIVFLLHFHHFVLIYYQVIKFNHAKKCTKRSLFKTKCPHIAKKIIGLFANEKVEIESNSPFVESKVHL